MGQDLLDSKGPHPALVLLHCRLQRRESEVSVWSHLCSDGHKQEQCLCLQTSVKICHEQQSGLHMNNVGLWALVEHLVRRQPEKLLLLNELFPDVDFSKHLAFPLPEGAGIS